MIFDDVAHHQAQAEYPFALNDSSTKEALLFTALYILLGGKTKARGQAKWITTVLYIAVAVADEFGVSLLDRVFVLMDSIGGDIQRAIKGDAGGGGSGGAGGRSTGRR